MSHFSTQRYIFVVVVVICATLTYLLFLGIPVLKSDGADLLALASQSWSRGNPTLMSEASVTCESEDETFLIPDDKELDKLNETQHQEIYWRYINTLQTLCRNQARIGVLTDGGKEICVDRAYRPQQPCLVYSFGSAYQFDFELLIDRAFSCEIHTFDPTMDTKHSNYNIPPTVKFHEIGLDEKDHVTPENWEMKTLETIIHDLGHANRTIDILKIDIEGAEWRSFAEMFTTGTLKRVKQLAVEFHNGLLQNSSTKSNLLVFRGLYEAGFRIFMRDRTLVIRKPLKTEYNLKFTPLTELSLVNVNFNSQNAKKVTESD